MKRVVAGAIVGLVCGAASASASADTFCVAPDASCTPAANNKVTIQDALTAAANNGNGMDTIKVGAATYSEGPLTAASGNPVAIVGKGAGQTIITGASSPETVLTLGDSGSSVTSVGIVVPAGSNNIGLSLLGQADGVAITGPNATTPTGVSLGGTFLRGSIDLPSSASTGVAGEFATLEDTTIRAHTGLAVTGPHGNAFARHDTFLGDGGSGSVGISAVAQLSLSFPGSITVTVDDSIVRGFATDLVRQGMDGDPMCIMDFGFCTTLASINYGYDDFDPGTPKTDTGPGSYQDNDHNQNAEPDFVSATASPPDYHLLYNSPLIDTGMTSVESGPPAESTQDEDGNPRTVGAATDIGAYEYQHRPPAVSVAASPSSVETGTPISFTATASDPDPGDTVTVSWAFDDGGAGSGTSVNHAFATPGTHTATATATDPTGLTATSTVSVTVTPLPPGPPVIAQLKLTPTAFRAARSGPSISAAKTGTTISYSDSQAADTSFIIERVASGIKRGRSCVKPPRKRPKHAKRCTRFVHLGGFIHRDVAGVNRFHFSGRIFGKALTPANYRLTAQPQNAKLLVGNVLKRQFRIIAPPRKRRHRH